VAMTEGSVKVSGACLPEPRPLHAGQTERFSCGKIASSNASSAPSAAEAAPKPKEPEAAPRKEERAPESAASARATAAPKASEPETKEPGWRDLVREGRFRDALLAAEREGYSTICTGEDAAAVLSLGNAARLAGNPGRATEAYLAVRQRFAGSAAAAEGAFQLGRFAFDGARDYGSSRRWFALYLTEQPGGPLAAEALGRLMESEHRMGDAPAAQKTATRYLASFSRGAHAALARSIVEAGSATPAPGAGPAGGSPTKL
jgi:transmembrane sensor